MALRLPYRHETFPRAPIVEALVQFRVILPHLPTQEQISRFADRIKDGFPNPRKLSRRVARAALSLVNEERTQALRVRSTDFIFSHLQPYSNWESLRAAALRYWPLYVDVFKPTRITHLGLQYINVVEMPGGPETISSMLSLIFVAPPEMLQNFETSLSQLTFKDQDSAARATVLSLASPPHNSTDNWSVLLSIGAQESRLKYDPNDHSLIFATLDKLRDLKNELFFSVTTEEAKRMFR